MIPPAAVEERLRAHVDDILRRADIPRADRDDLAEELYGHLVECWTARVAEGADDATATRDAVTGFGSTERIGRDLNQAYRGRFWASTIGPLLPAKAPPTAVPSIGRLMLSWAVCTMAAVAAGGALDMLTTLTPLRALIVGAAWAAGAGVLLLAGVALLRGQRWALLVSIGVCAASALDGIASYVRSPGFTPLLAFIAAAALVVAALDRRKVWESTASRQRPPRLLLAGLVGVLIAAFAAGPLLATIEDPTQASAENLELDVRVRCDEVDERPVDATVRRWTVDVFWEWSRTSVLPGGIRGWERHTDALVLREPGEDWWLASTRPPRQTPSDRPIGWQGGGAPSASAIPPDLVSSAIDYGIKTSETHSNVRYHAAWVLHSQTWTEKWPEQAEVWYFHGDTWRLVATAGCDERGSGAPPDG